MPSPMGAAPPIPGITATEGMSPDMISPMALMMMMKGMNPGEDTTARKIEQVISLLREIAEEDPRIAPLTSDALRLLTEGPNPGQGPQASPAPMPNQPMPAGGPGGMIA